jgi:hypothetical protein
MYVWKTDWTPWIKLYLEVRPDCLLYLFVTIFEYFSYRPLKVLEALESLSLRVEDIPAFMKAFLESGQTIHLTKMEVEDLEQAMRFLEKMCTKDEIERCVLRQFLKDLKESGMCLSFSYLAEGYKHIYRLSDWASRLGFREIASDIKAFCLESDMHYKCAHLKRN